MNSELLPLLALIPEEYQIWTIILLLIVPEILRRYGGGKKVVQPLIQYLRKIFSDEKQILEMRESILIAISVLESRLEDNDKNVADLREEIAETLRFILKVMNVKEDEWLDISNERTHLLDENQGKKG